ncbi:MAG: 16S rRNA (guanine(966)-N(2))-methyltransferase RsmD [Desulfobacteraceae bacterium]|nr:16S rRNA (guanine(966)-N(2))-methyltransferase RsmD [Desulfobacteraceae bacterium]MBC2755096.1 16S rRNA (guanine(966)-N(2))-methyltransferase RsmD [Desulfobacteraceae bacterium]
MRIISGEFKGKKLVSLRGAATRPTADRVRESIFNILTPNIFNASVLDLFSGTGALGLEALSRGAASAVFIDSSASAVKTIQKNITACRAETRARVIRWDITKNLNCLQSEASAVDLVFMDPPYNKNYIVPTLKKLMKRDALKNGATIIIEHSAAEAVPKDLMGLHMTDHRIYGKTLVSFLSVMLQENLSGAL